MDLVVRGNSPEEGLLEGFLQAEIPCHCALAEGWQQPSYVSLKYRGRECGAFSRLVDTKRADLVVDPSLRLFLRAPLGSTVQIEILEPPEADSVSLSVPTLWLNRQELVEQHLLGKPLCKGLRFPIFTSEGGKIDAQVLEVQPEGIAVVAASTTVSLRSWDSGERQGSTTASDGQQAPPVGYIHIGGLKREIERIRMLVEHPLRHPEAFGYFGIEAPRGLLLYGPPGTGKTLIARALSNEVGAKFHYIQGPEIVTPMLGGSEQRLREIFKEAQSQPPAVILIDEIDAIAPRRDRSQSDAEHRLVAQLLTLLDGLRDLRGVVVIGTTNRRDSIDPALRRPGRFEHEILIGPPDREGRRQILRIYATRMPKAEDVDLDVLANATAGFVGADIAALCREAGRHAIGRYFPLEAIESGEILVDSGMRVSQQDFLQAVNEVQPSAMREVTVEVVRDASFAEVGGHAGIKQALVDNVVYGIAKSDVFAAVNKRPAKGILLYGPPGTGKTLLARAVAHEAQANLITLRGPDIHRRWFGESEEIVRSTFSKARELAPAIILLDDIDSLTPARGGSNTSGAMESIVSQVVAEMERVQVAEGVFVVAATSAPDLIDPALVRPGRIDLQLHVQLPTEEERIEIFDLHLRSIRVDHVDVRELAKETEGLSGADIAECCRLAFFEALRGAGSDPATTVVDAGHLSRARDHVRHAQTHLKRRLGFDVGRRDEP